MESIGFCILGILAIVVFAKLFAWPLKMLLKLIINGVLGAILLVLVNLVGGMFGVTIGINVVTALIAGFFGVPGVIFLILFKVLL